MAKNPVLPFYYNDILGSTNDWSDEEFGAYVRLLIYQWDKGFIPDEEKRRLKIADTSDVHWGLLSTKFREWEDGKLRNDRMEEIREEKRKHSEKQKENIKKRYQKSTKVLPNDYQSAYEESTKKIPLEDEYEEENIDKDKGGEGEKGEGKIDAGTKVLLVPELLQIWKQSCPDYVASIDIDFPALRSIAESLAIRMNITNYTDFEGVNDIKKAFQLIVKFIKSDNHFKNYQISQVDKYFNAITSKMKSEHEEKKAGKSILQTNLSAAQNARNIVAEKYSKSTNN